MNSIEIRDVQKSYRSVTMTYQNRILSSPRTILIGSNGSGKSTLLHAIVGLIEYDGEIAMDGRISFMPEIPMFPRDCTIHTFLQALSNNDPTPLIELFELQGKETERISSLSKGMKGKLNVIQCLNQDAEWYILDEPESGLDRSTQQLLYQWLNTTDKQWIITTHHHSIFDQLNAEVIDLDSDS